MTDAPPVSIPAGWYADPSRVGQLRWWDGSAWTSHVAPAPPGLDPRVPQSTVAPEPVEGSLTQATDSVPPRSWNTAAAWVLATTPLWALSAEILVLLIGGYFETANLNLTFLDAVTATALAVVLVAIVIVSATRDASRLRAAGYPRVASAAWILLGPLVYLIARSVRVYRSARRGIAPLMFYLVSSAVLGLVLTAFAAAIPVYLDQHGGITDQANATSFARGVARGLDESGNVFRVTCTPFSPPTTTPISIICDATDGAQVDHKMIIEVQPSSSSGGQPSFRLVSVNPPISR